MIKKLLILSKSKTTMIKIRYWLFPFLISLLCVINNSCTKPKNKLIEIKTKWNINIDGIVTSWEGVYSIHPFYFSVISCNSNEEGQCIQQNLGVGYYNILMTKGNTNVFTQNSISVGLNINTGNTIGTTTINSASFNSNSTFDIKTYNSEYKSYLPNTNITVNITEVPSNNDRIGLLKGNFSGVIGKLGGGTSNISGSFEAFTKIE
jgi:hypothetical protein